jgi:hypothetical protein
LVRRSPQPALQRITKPWNLSKIKGLTWLTGLS